MNDESPKITHLDDNGDLRMVDVSRKTPSWRTASAKALVRFPAEVYAAIQANKGQLKKGSIFEVSRIAGITAAKRCADLIPLCHPLALERCDIHFIHHTEACVIEVQSELGLSGKTGVEMEALTAVSGAALCLYDMAKALSHDIVIEEISLVAKQGGKRDFDRRQP